MMNCAERIVGFLVLTATLAASGWGSATAQTFVPVGAGLPLINSGSACWGDYDADGDLDLLLTGRTTLFAIATALYRNDAGTFTDAAAALADVYGGAAGWGDYDNDNDLDLVLTGWDASSIRRSIIYRNDGGGTFTDIGAQLLGVAFAAVDWGDYDNDGDLDLLVMGGGDFPETHTMRLYRNDGGDHFALSPAVLEGMIRGSVEWGDFDSDGDLDILATGEGQSDPVLTLVYRNDGNETFARLGAGLKPLYDGEARWGDYDQDGDLDILADGSEATATAFDTRVYRNDGGGTFTDIGATLDNAGEGSNLAVGDCDNDGDLDVVVSSIFSDTTDGVAVYRYDGDSVFADLHAGIGAGCCGSVAWGDYDNDHDLDLAVALLDGVNALYRNDATPANTLPVAPSGLSAGVNGSAVTLNWQPGTDAETVPAGLTYNLRVGTTPGGSEVVSAMADPVTGYRRIPDFGNADHNLSRTIVGLDQGTYFWSVQSIDNSFTGSAPAPEETFTIGPVICDCTSHGDVTGDDGIIDILDVLGLAGVVFQGAAVPVSDPLCPHVNRGDINCDGVNNVRDIVQLIDHTSRGGAGPCNPCD